MSSMTSLFPVQGSWPCALGDATTKRHGLIVYPSTRAHSPGIHSIWPEAISSRSAAGTTFCQRRAKGREGSEGQRRAKGREGSEGQRRAKVREGSEGADLQHEGSANNSVGLQLCYRRQQLGVGGYACLCLYRIVAVCARARARVCVCVRVSDPV